MRASASSGLAGDPLGLGGHVPPLLRPAAAEICAAGGASGELHNLRRRRQRPGAAPGDRPAARSTPPHFSPEAIAAAISWAKNNLIAPEQYQPRPGHALGRGGRAGLPGLPGPARQVERRRFRRPAAPRGHAAARQSRGPRGARRALPLHPGRRVSGHNLAQYAIARALSIDHPNLAVTGDPTSRSTAGAGRI